MQTRIEFEVSSTLRDWGNFKEMLVQKKEGVRPRVQGGSKSEKLIYHLTRQLNAGLLK